MAHHDSNTYIAQEITSESIAQFVANNCDIYQNTALLDPHAHFHELMHSALFRERMQSFYDNFAQHALQYGIEEAKRCKNVMQDAAMFACA